MKLSRHAQNNLRLYSITAAEIQQTIISPDHREREGNRILAYKKFPGRFAGLPLKVVYVLEKNEEMVITAYPLKKEYRRR